MRDLDRHRRVILGTTLRARIVRDCFIVRLMGGIVNRRKVKKRFASS